MNAEFKEVSLFMEKPESCVTSFKETFAESKTQLNNIMQWASEELEASTDCKAYIDCFTPKQKSVDSIVRGVFLFPTYVLYCQRYGLKPVAHRNFSSSLIEACKYLNIKAEKSRDKISVFIKGVRIKSIVKDTSYQIGGEIDTSISEISCNSNLSKLSINNISTDLTEDNSVKLIESSDSTEVTEFIDVTDSVKSVKSIESSDSTDLTESVKLNKGPGRSEATKFITLKSVHGTLNPEIYDLYIQNLTRKSKFRQDLNQFSKTIEFNETICEDLLDKYCKSRNIVNPTPGFLDVKRKHFFDCAKKLEKHGITIYAYKSSGILSRILLVNYKNTINFFNKAFRSYLFTKLGNYMDHTYDMVLLDLDIVSCYTCVLLGLYPDKLPLISQAVRSGSIWNSLKQEFIDRGKGEVYNKTYAKAYFYSVIFSGGATAMIESVLTNLQESLGMRPQEFKDAEFYDLKKSKVNELATVFNGLPMVQEFRAMSESVQNTHDGEFFTGPTGTRYPINKSEFRKSFALHLQSFEFCLIAETTNETLKKFPESELLFAFHDGNVVAVKESEASEFLKEIQKQMEETSKKLSLLFKQRIELQNAYPTNEELFKIIN